MHETHILGTLIRWGTEKIASKHIENIKSKDAVCGELVFPNVDIR